MAINPKDINRPLGNLKNCARDLNTLGQAAALMGMTPLTQTLNAIAAIVDKSADEISSLNRIAIQDEAATVGDNISGTLLALLKGSNVQS